MQKSFKQPSKGVNSLILENGTTKQTVVSMTCYPNKGCKWHIISTSTMPVLRSGVNVSYVFLASSLMVGAAPSKLSSRRGLSPATEPLPPSQSTQLGGGDSDAAWEISRMWHNIGRLREPKSPRLGLCGSGEKSPIATNETST